MMKDLIMEEYNDLSCHKLTCIRGARWPRGRVSDSKMRGQGSIPTSAVLCKDAFTPRKVLVISRKLWHRAYMKDIVEWDVKHF